MAEIVKQGDVDILGTLLYTGSDSQVLTKIITLSFNNPANYRLILERYDAASAGTIVLYDLNLSGGDTVNDTLTYALNPGDRLTVYTDIPGTTYYLYGIDYGSN